MKAKYVVFEVGCNNMGMDGDGNEDHCGYSYTIEYMDEDDLGGKWLNIEVKNHGDPRLDIITKFVV